MLSTERWAGTIATKASVIRAYYLNHLRTPRLTAYKYISNAGWHFTNQGGVDRIRLKLESYGHQEYNTEEVKSLLEQRIRNRADFLGRPWAFTVDSTGLPEVVLAQRQRYPHMFVPTT
jgi:beta-1,4-mannosyl-glycoprotein beta-1,4-N-acetylglucosaminyltransferase